MYMYIYIIYIGVLKHLCPRSVLPLPRLLVMWHVEWRIVASGALIGRSNKPLANYLLNPRINLVVPDYLGKKQ